MNARFNGYYHAQVLVEGGMVKLEEIHKDNFSEILSVFPYGTEDDSKAVTADMDNVYKKTSKVIRKHPNSKWEDDCYLLMGQAYFFKYEPYEAVEIFQHINKKYKNSTTRYDAQLWILKSYIRQERYNDAEAIMGLFLQDANFPNRLKKDLNAIAAEIYIKQGKYTSAIEKLELALSLSKSRSEKYRWNYILGQLYLQSDNWLKARDHFVYTIKLNPPYDLAFQANLGLIKTISMGEGSLKTPKKYLNRMLRDDKNIDYYDQIYFELANIAVKEGNQEQAITYYQLSARNSTKNNDQKASAYLELANIYFKKRDYPESQSYFDSTVAFISEKHPNYDGIKAQHLILSELIENLVTVKEQDSLLYLASLPPKELEKMIDDIIRGKQLEAERLATEKEMNSMANEFNQPTRIQQDQTQGSGFYFYNTAAVARGKAEFARKWGSRKKGDYWRIATLARTQVKEVDNEVVEEEQETITYTQSSDKEQQKFLEEIPQDKRAYYENIPLSDLGKKIAHQKIEQALFNIGLLYEEKLKEYDTAIVYFLKVLARYPDTRFGAETYYHLHRCYSKKGNEAKAEEYARILNDRFSDSKYNEVVNNRDVVRAPGEEDAVIRLYERMYNAYKSGDYETALAIREEANKKYYGNSIQAQFDYLHALVIGESGDIESYIELLQGIVQNYPGTQIANQAEYTIEYLSRKANQEEAPETEMGDYTFDPAAEHYFAVVFEGGKTSDIMVAFSNYNKEYHSLKKLNVKSMVLGNKEVIIIQSFKDKGEAEKYYIEFIKNSQFYKDLGILAYDNYFISKFNFGLMLKEGNTDTYANFFLKNYIQ